MDGFSTDDYNHSSYYFDQQADYPWVIDNTDPTFTNDDSTTIHLNSNAYQDITSNVSSNPYDASIGILPGEGFHSNGAIGSFDHSTGTDRFLLLPTVQCPHLVVYILYGASQKHIALGYQLRSVIPVLSIIGGCHLLVSGFFFLILTDFKFQLVPQLPRTSISHLNTLKILIQFISKTLQLSSTKHFKS
jgi:hypothetical protein